MTRRNAGISGTALFLGTVSMYLVYVGVKDVPFFEGLRELFRTQRPTPRAEHAPYAPDLGSAAATGATAAEPGPNDRGIAELQGPARTAYSVFRRKGNWTIYGFGLRPSGTSDHPRGLALDIMNPTEAEAQAIIATFRSLPGAKYWIWNRHIANAQVDNWRIRPYTGLSPHTDHVHLSFFAASFFS